MRRRPAADRYALLEEATTDMTPLIDCVVLLLVFFMMTTAFFTLRSIQVQMPGEASSATAEVARDINVYIAPSGEVQVQGRTVAVAGLREALGQIALTQGMTSVVLEAADQVRHERIIEVLDQAKAAGIKEVVFAKVEESAGGR